MLVLVRKPNEEIIIGEGDDAIVVKFLEHLPGQRGGPGKARIGIEAPRDVRVMRRELVNQPREFAVAKK
jgi:carbon storage regulator CsrA